MKRNLSSLVVLITMLLGLVASADAAQVPLPDSTPSTKFSQPQKIVVRVYFSSPDGLNKLAARFDILEINHDQGYVLIILSPDTYTILQQSGNYMEVDENKTRLLNQPLQALPGQGADTIPGYPCFRSVEKTYADLQNIAIIHPDMAQIFDIGDSWDKTVPGGNPGYDIIALRLSNEKFGVMDDKPAFFLMAEIHARELTTAETALRFAEYLIGYNGIDPDITWLLNYYRVYIVAMTNPDGRKIAETGLLWRKNVDNDDGCTDPARWGTDLNRNHSFHWVGSGSSPNACDETYRGPTAGSEPETQAIQNFILTLFPDQRGPSDTDAAPDSATGVFITLHSYARVILYPWGWSITPSPNAIALSTLGRKFGFFNGYAVCQSSDPLCMYSTNGTSDDWAYGNLGIAAYTFEIGTNFFEYCSSFESTTYPENLAALLYAFKAARRPYQNPAGPDSFNINAAPDLIERGNPVLITASADDTRYNSNGHGAEPTQNILAARYSIDNPSWIPGTTTYDMLPSDGSFNSEIEGLEATIDTTDLSIGKHTVFIESMDADGNWGVSSAAFLDVIEPGTLPVNYPYYLPLTKK
jgi:carboxypeptidase T